MADLVGRSHCAGAPDAVKAPIAPCNYRHFGDAIISILPQQLSPKGVAKNANETKWTSIYYCDPMRSGQKGGIEQTHTMLRMVFPKGTSFEFLPQWDVNLIMNHINSTPRESLDGKTPFQAALVSFGEDTLKTLQLRAIVPGKSILKPKLIPAPINPSRNLLSD